MKRLGFLQPLCTGPEQSVELVCHWLETLKFCIDQVHTRHFSEACILVFHH